MNDAQTTTSTFDGIGPASLKTLTSASFSATVPLHFQLPPIKYLRAPSAEATSFVDPDGRLFRFK